MTHAEQATQYCRDVLDGTVIAGNWIKLAARRQLDDLAKSESDPEYPYRFSAKKANRICNFAELCPHIKGSLAQRRELIKLEPFQKFFLGSIFGWVRKSDGLRRFRTAMLWCPRKNGKSLIASVIGLYMLLMDGEAGAEVLAGASSLEQAGYVFKPAQQIVEKTVGLRQLGCQVLANALVVPSTGSKMMAVIGKPPDGSNPSCSICDELQEQNDDILVSTMVTGMGSRDQPLLIATTTAGYNTGSPAFLMQQELQDVLQGHKDNPELYGLLFCPDENVPWTSELALRQANPNMGISVREDYLLQQQREAISIPRKQTSFKTKNLNIWCSSSVSWLPLEKWNACADSTLRLDDFIGQPCWIGLDLASKLDLTCASLVFKRDDKFILFQRFYLPEARIEEIQNAHYKTWHEHGYLEAVPGQVNSQQELLDDILADAKRFELREIAHDPYGAAHLVAQLSEHGQTCVEIQQTWKGMSEPFKSMEALVLSRQILHTGNPVMSFCVANTKARVDRLENAVPDKQSPEKKIDGVVSAVMALGRAQLAPKPSAGFMFVA